MFFSVAERLQTDIARALRRVLRKNSFQVLIVNKFVLWVRMEYNVIALRAGKCKEHTCLLRCKRAQGATQIHGQIIDFEVVENGPGTIIRKSGGVDVILVLIA